MTISKLWHELRCVMLLLPEWIEKLNVWTWRGRERKEEICISIFSSSSPLIDGGSIGTVGSVAAINHDHDGSSDLLLWLVSLPFFETLFELLNWVTKMKQKLWPLEIVSTTRRRLKRNKQQLWSGFLIQFLLLYCVTVIIIMMSILFFSSKDLFVCLFFSPNSTGWRMISCCCCWLNSSSSDSTGFDSLNWFTCLRFNSVSI